MGFFIWYLHFIVVDLKNKIRTMKVNIIKAKDDYAKSCGSLDWHDHVNGMSAIDVELEMEYVLEQVTTKMLEMLEYCWVALDAKGMKNKANEIEQLIKQATEL